MIWKLQFKTFLPLQLIGYAVTLCIGVIIILTTYNIYSDLQPILKEETDVFGNNGVVISKEIRDASTVIGGFNSIKGNSIDRSSIYFNNEEINNFKKQSFVDDISFFNTASGFNIYLYIGELGLRTDIFFESIPDKYLEIVNEQNKNLWKWNETSSRKNLKKRDSHLERSVGMLSSENRIENEKKNYHHRRSERTWARNF